MGGQDLSIYEYPERNMSLDYSIQQGAMIACTKRVITCLARNGIRANYLTLGGLQDGSRDDPVFQKGYRRRIPMGRMVSERT